MEYKIKTGPTVEPISLTEAKLHLRVSNTLEDTLITALIKSARMMCEEITNRQLITATWELFLDEFPDLFAEPEDAIQLFPVPMGDISAITYVDMNGETQTWASTLYRLDAISEPARLSPVYGQSWPQAREITNSIKITYTAGYGATSVAVPEPIKTAMLLMIGHWYANREEVIIGRIATQLPLATKFLLDPYRVTLFR